MGKENVRFYSPITEFSPYKFGSRNALPPLIGLVSHHKVWYLWERCSQCLLCYYRGDSLTTWKLTATIYSWTCRIFKQSYQSPRRTATVKKMRMTLNMKQMT